MSELTDEIVNRGLAEFMGFVVDNLQIDLGFIEGYYDQDTEQEYRSINLYTESLDALVPVWEKIKQWEIRIGIFYGDKTMRSVSVGYTGMAQQGTIQQAAAYATYKACEELGLI